MPSWFSCGLEPCIHLWKLSDSVWHCWAYTFKKRVQRTSRQKGLILNIVLLQWIFVKYRHIKWIYRKAGFLYTISSSNIITVEMIEFVNWLFHTHTCFDVARNYIQFRKRQLKKAINIEMTKWIQHVMNHLVFNVFLII